MSTTQGRAGMWWGLLGVVIFSISLPMAKVALAWFDPVVVAFSRVVIAAGLSAVALLATKSAWPTWRQARLLGLAALGVTVGFPIFSSWAMQVVPAGHGAVVNGLLPLATAALGAVVIGYRPRWPFWVAAVIGSVTAVAVVLWQSGSGVTFGDTAMLIAVLLAAVGYVYGGQLAGEIGGWRTICWANVLAAPVLLGPVWWHLPSTPVPWLGWGALVYLGVFSMFLGFVAWYHGLATGGVQRVSQVQLIQPFLTIIWAWPIDGEQPTWGLFVAATVVVTCIWVARKVG